MRYALASAAGMPLLPTTEGQPEAGALPAPNEKVQALMTHWEQAVTEVGFLDPQHPKKLMPRMRHMFGRNGLSHDEVDMMRGLCTRSEENTSELQSLMRTSYAVFCLKKKQNN